MMKSTIEDLLFEVVEPMGLSRTAEPVSVGIPVPDGLISEALLSLSQDWSVQDPDGRLLPCQCRVLSVWPSKAVKWLLVTLCVDSIPFGTKTYRLLVPTGHHNAPAIAGDDWGEQRVVHGYKLAISNRKEFAPQLEMTFSAQSKHGKRIEFQIEASNFIERGPLVERVQYQLRANRSLVSELLVTRFHRRALVKFEWTLHNPLRAEHAGNFWDLGDPQSVLLRSVTCDLAFATEKMDVQISPELDKAFVLRTDGESSLVQANSGGENAWSRTHVTRNGEVRFDFDGYRLTFGEKQQMGGRAQPVLFARCNQGGAGLAFPEFWQRFPAGLRTRQNNIAWDFFPCESDCHELQPGEQVTKSFWLQLMSPDEENANRPEPLTKQLKPADLRWVYAPLVARPLLNTPASELALEWSISAGKITKSDISANDWSDKSALSEMLEGPRNFYWKREQIDEYGWRNYGDFWADHEEAYADDPKPVISHYNNQYDLLQGLIRQFLATGDQRFWQLAGPLAQHILDIDIYHTNTDRAAFNGGMFWHTAHYRTAGTSTHRSFSRSMGSGKHRVAGGGPGPEHIYSTGLCLYYQLSGDSRAKLAVLAFADRVITMDDGAQHLLAPFSSARTGLSSSTAQTDYHGPGRGVGNSINTLIDAWQMSLDSKYLEKCRELIYRVVHPSDDISKLDLLNAEVRWSYTVAFQALAKYVVVVGERDAETVRYVQACLISYGRWMLENERLYLDNPGELEFPTESWAAQDLRKANCLLMAAALTHGAEAENMISRGRELFKSAWEQLEKFDTRVCTRPAALVLQQLPIYHCLMQNAGRELAAGSRTEDLGYAWPHRVRFVPQKKLIVSALKSPLGIMKTAVMLIRPLPWRLLLPHTKLGSLIRKVRRRISQ